MGKNVELAAVNGKPVDVQLWDDKRIEDAIAKVCWPTDYSICALRVMHSIRDEYEDKVSVLLNYISTLERGGKPDVVTADDA